MTREEKCLDSKLWHACAGGMVQMPVVNSKVFYFPQGHAEHSHATVDFGAFTRIPAYVLCRVVHVKFMADPDTDEVYANISLLPINTQDYNSTNNHPPLDPNNLPDKPASFAKTLTQSDANNGGGFSVPRYCAETIFPPLDYSADPPLQTVFAKDVHGEIWKFRHIYRGTPRRHLLTTGWSNFVNHKKLVAGDSIVFLRTENGDLCVGIRRAKRVIGGAGPHESPSGWNPATSNSAPPPYGGGPYSAFLREDESKLIRNANYGNSHSSSASSFRGKGKVRPESVIEAATLAANGQPFEVVYYPRASTPEFCVKASSVMEATQVQWTSGMRFKMAFETEDSSRISWFMGTVSAVQVADPIRWPGSPWRLLQVTWDEPDLLQNVKRVNPWLVELVANMPTVHLSPLMPPRKKVRLPQHPDFPFDGQFAIPSLSSNPLGPSSFLCCALDNTSAGIQGARHAQFSTSFSDLHLNKLQPGQFQAGIQRFHHPIPSSRVSSSIITAENQNSDENISCLLTMGLSTHISKKSEEKKKPQQLMLFGQPILTEQQISLSCSGGPVSPVVTGNSCSDGNVEKTANFSDGAIHQPGPPENSSSEGFPWYKDHRHMTEIGLETGHCKVFMESEDVGRTLDLSVLGSYEELYRKLADMFGIERSEMLSRVLYRDENGAVKYTGDESFSKFAKTTKRLTILMDSGSDNRGR